MTTHKNFLTFGTFTPLAESEFYRYGIVTLTHGTEIPLSTMRFDPELSKGSIQLLILAVLQDGPLHGYGISKVIEKTSGGVLSFGDGSVYPALHNLSKKGLLRFEWEPANIGPARKIYSLTDEGKSEYQRKYLEYQDYIRATSLVLKTPESV